MKMYPSHSTKKASVYAYLLAAFMSLFLYDAGRAYGEGNSKDLKINGYIRSDDRVRLKDSQYSFHEYRLDLKGEAKPNDNAHFFSDVWFRSIGFPSVKTSDDLTNKDKVSPYGLDFREGYADIYGLFIDGLDFRIGRQRITWGTADRLNPTDNLNPLDLEDIWDFGRHLGSDSIKATYYKNDWSLTAVFIPIFTPGVLPSGDAAILFTQPVVLPGALSLGTQVNNVILPENSSNLGSTLAVKAGVKNLAGYDFTVSYAHTHDSLPIASKVTLTSAGSPGIVNVNTELTYPSMNILGADMAGTLGSVGVWAEAAAFYPEKVMMTEDLTAFAMGTQQSVALDSKSYVKYVVGGDYTFKNGIYVNGQVLHGFYSERGDANLENYVMFKLEYKMLNDKVKITPISGGAEIKDKSDTKNYAIMYTPEISYLPIDNAEFNLGAHIISNKGTTTFGRMRDYGDAYLNCKYSF